MDNKSNIKTLKIILLGDVSVGKTSIINQYIYNKYNYSIESTIGAAYFSKKKSFNYDPNTYTLSDKKDSNILNIQLNIWDTAGQEKYKSLVSMYYKNADIVFYVFDKTNYNKLNYNILNNLSENTKIVILFNKSDLIFNKSKSYNDSIIEICKKNGWEYYIVSAKTNDNIQHSINNSIQNFVKENLYNIINKQKINPYNFEIEENNDYFNCC